MKVLLSKGVTNAVGKTIDVSWEAFGDLVKQHNVARPDESDREKRSAPWFSTAEYAGGHRRRENLRGKIWAIVADLDEVRDETAVEKALSRYEYIAWTTWRSTAERPRWRVVLPIENGGIEPERFGSLVDRVLAPLKDSAKIDVRTRMPEQLWFLPWHKRSAKAHELWQNSGSWIKEGRLIHVDFTGVKLAHKPEEVEEGERNSTLVMRLTESDALRCESREDLMDIAKAWNARLRTPMKGREVADVVRKKWNWMQRGEGLVRRTEAWRGHVELPDIGVGLMSNEIRSARIPPPIVGDFLHPGATMISAKMKEGKSFLAMQLAMSIAAGTAFLKGDRHPGFTVHKKLKAVLIAGEDTAGGISNRFLGSIASGALPQPARVDDVLLVFNKDLDSARKTAPRMPALSLFENMVSRWYERGYRVIAIDPLRVLEGALGIDEYPGHTAKMNAHVRDFQTMRYYTKVAQGYDDLVILISMHHGKNKRDHDASDPGDMIAGTTGYGAGAVATVALLPIPEQLEAEEDQGGMTAKRRVLYLHGRYTKEQRYLCEQNARTGVWAVLGPIADEMMSLDRQRYFEILIELGATKAWVSSDAVRKSAKRNPVVVRKILRKMHLSRETYLGWRLIGKKGPGGGYRLIGGRVNSWSSDEES